MVRGTRLLGILMAVLVGLATPGLELSSIAVYAAPSTARTTGLASEPLAGIEAPPKPLAPGQEVVSKRTRTSRTYVGAHGGLLTEVTPGSQNYSDSSGNWHTIDNTVVASTVPGYGYQNKANRYRLLLPADLARSPVQTELGGQWATMKLVGATGSPKVSGNSVTYVNALPGVNLQYEAQNDSVKEDIVVWRADAAANLQFDLGLSTGITAVGNTTGGIDLNGSNGPLISLLAAGMSDSATVPERSSSVHLSLSQSGSGLRVAVQPDLAWLSDPARVWPVVIDPSEDLPLNTDCYIVNGSSANTNFCSAGTLNVGFDGSAVSRSLLLFDLPVEDTETIGDASLKLELSSAQSSQAQSVELHDASQSWNSGVTWNQAKSDGTLWTTPGGSFNATPQSTISVGPTTGVDYFWPLTSLVQSWVRNNQTTHGLLLKVANEGATGLLQFYSDRASCLPSCRQPRLTIEQFNGTGEQPWYKLDSRKLTDRMGLSVNQGSANLILAANDISIQGTGINLKVNHLYNSRAYLNGQLGGNWQLSVGRDLFLETGTGSGSWDGPIFHQQDGSVSKFTQSGSGFTTPAGLNASLQQVDSTHWRLTYNQSAEKLNFTNLGDPSCVGCAYETSDQDRNGNTISFSYDSSFRLATITDTQNRQLTLQYTNPDDSTLITSISDPSGRQWQYAYWAGTNNLKTYTDPNGKVTSFSYSSFPLLTQITDPHGNVIQPGYGVGASPDWATSVGYVNSACAGGTCTYSFTYNEGSQSPCTAANVGDTTLRTDPRGNTITNCLDTGMRALQTFDGLVHAGQITYTGNNDAQNLTDSLSQVTQLSYDLNNNLTQFQAPASAPGQTPASNLISYQAPGQSFLPSSRTDAQGNCRAFTYDAAGNLSDVYDGQASGCDGQTGGAHLANRYQGDPGVSCPPAKNGDLCSTIDAKGNTTSYGYDGNGNVTSITPPSPLGVTTIVRDSLSRVSNVTDGKGQTTRYSYDKLDRITQILYAGATSCTSSATCTTFVYDEDGNLTSRTDNVGTTSFRYDTMNRLKTKSLPDTSVACSGSNPAGLTFSYDGADNLTTYCDSGGTISYGYDAANRLTALAEPGGSVTSGGACNVAPCSSFSYDNDDRRTQAHFPGGATLNLSYDNSGNQLTAIGKDKNGNILTSFTYVFSNGSADRQFRQTSSENDAVATNTYSYSYDSQARLTAATISAGTGTNYAYGYDAAGNITSRTVGSSTTSYAYNAANELCWASSGASNNDCTSPPAGATTYSFDADGNETGSSAGASFAYNAKNQTTAVTYGGTTVTGLTYSDSGQSQRTTSGSTTFANGPAGEQISTTGGSRTYFTRDSHGHLIGERIGSSNYYYLTDSLGSVVAVISGDGLSIGDRYGYDPYGNITYHSGTVANPWGYAGGYTDTTGLVKFGARYHDPSVGRWTQQDPLASIRWTQQDPLASNCQCATGTVSLYAYAADNPVYHTDPTGLQIWYWCWVADVFCWVHRWFYVIECIEIFYGQVAWVYILVMTDEPC